MSLELNINQPLAIYEDLEQQVRFKKGGAHNVFDLLCPHDEILPFQIRKDDDYFTINDIVIKAVNDTSINVNVLTANGMTDVIHLEDKDVLVCFGGKSAVQLPKGKRYYYEIHVGSKVYYSEIFKAIDVNTCEHTLFTYYDTCDLGGFIYNKEANRKRTQYMNKMYLDVDTSTPTYDLNTSADELPDGSVDVSGKTASKTYLIERVFPEYIIDAFMCMFLHVGGTSVLTVRTFNGLVSDVKDLKMSKPKWEGTLGTWASVSLSFKTDYYSKTGCCEKLSTSAYCLRNTKTALTVLSSVEADFFGKRYKTNEGKYKLLEENDVVIVYNDNADRYGLKMMQDNNGVLQYGEVPDDLQELDTYRVEHHLHGYEAHQYYFYASHTKGMVHRPIIDSAVFGKAFSIQGRTYSEGLVEVTGITSTNGKIKLGTFTPLEFLQGINYNVSDNNIVAVKIIHVGAKCTVSSSAPVAVTGGNTQIGIGNMAIGNGFTVAENNTDIK